MFFLTGAFWITQTEVNFYHRGFSSLGPDYCLRPFMSLSIKEGKKVWCGRRGYCDLEVSDKAKKKERGSLMGKDRGRRQEREHWPCKDPAMVECSLINMQRLRKSQPKTWLLEKTHPTEIACNSFTCFSSWLMCTWKKRIKFSLLSWSSQDFQ